MNRYLVLLGAILLLTLSGISPLAAVSAASAADGGVVTWSLVPANAQGADGRAVIERDVDPGESVEEWVEVHNFGDTTVTFALDAADGYYTEDDRFAMRESSQESVDAGTWISVENSVTVPGGGHAVVPVTIAVPSDATPGDHLVGVAAAVASAAEGGSGGASVAVNARVGVAIALHVSGQLHSELSSTVLGAYVSDVNPFVPGSLDVDYTVTNTGNTLVSVEGTVTASGPGGLLPTRIALSPVDRLAPGETRSGRVTVTGVWPTFVTTVGIAMDAVSVDDSALTATSVATSTAASVPLPQLAVLAGAAALVAIWVVDRRRQRRRIAAAAEEAHRRGIAEGVSHAR